MGEKIRKGMLCTFISRRKGTWLGEKQIPTPKQDARSFWSIEPVAGVEFSSPLVTVLEKRATKYASLWTSYALVMGVDKNKQSAKAWILASLLKPVKNPSKANPETDKP